MLKTPIIPAVSRNRPDSLPGNPSDISIGCLHRCIADSGIRLLLLASLGLLQSCASYGDHATTMRDGLLSGMPAVSLSIEEQADPDEKEVLPSLEKGMLRRMTNDYTGSNQIFEVAKKKIEELYGISVTENLASVTVNDTLRSYEGDRHEQLLLHAYMAMNYIDLGQIDGARVEMLQASVKMREWGDEPEEDAFLRYLEGIIYENMGEQDNALISYRKAYTVYKEKGGQQYPVAPALIKKDLLRMLKVMGLKSEYESYAKEFGLLSYKPPGPDKAYGELVVILNNGLAPVKGEASVYIFSSEVQQNLRVAFPVYRQRKKTLNIPSVEVDDRSYAMETVEDVDTLARYSLQKAMPMIMVRATARAVVKYNTQHTAQNQGSLAGFLMTVTNLVTERADTRSWTTLPQEIELQRIRLPVGEHKVQIKMMNAAGHAVDVISEEVVIRPDTSSFIIKHWIAPVPKVAVKAVKVSASKSVNDTNSTL
ncbi:MAG: hypothetical protein IMF14_09610 [Proteobacteria bacterium]|nr:hypothetical protein [Pseudomonadota bacterium]